MRIVVTLVIDIENPSEWTDAYGAEGDANIEEDVKKYIFNHVHGAPFWDDVESYVSLRD